jgi:hypothetical protein
VLEFSVLKHLSFSQVFFKGKSSFLKKMLCRGESITIVSNVETSVQFFNYWRPHLKLNLSCLFMNMFIFPLSDNQLSRTGYGLDKELVVLVKLVFGPQKIFSNNIVWARIFPNFKPLFMKKMSIKKTI